MQTGYYQGMPVIIIDKTKKEKSRKGKDKSKLSQAADPVTQKKQKEPSQSPEKLKEESLNTDDGTKFESLENKDSKKSKQSKESNTKADQSNKDYSSNSSDSVGEVSITNGVGIGGSFPHYPLPRPGMEPYYPLYSNNHTLQPHFQPPKPLNYFGNFPPMNSAFSNNYSNSFQYSKGDFKEKPIIEPDINKENIGIHSLDQLLQKNEQELIVFLQSKIGSKTVQMILTFIEESNQKIPDNFFNKLKAIDLPTVMHNKYGSFFFEKFVVYLSLEQRLEILTSKSFQDSFVELCCGRFSNMVIQALVKSLKDRKQEEAIIRGLMKERLSVLSSSQCANFVLNQVIICFSYQGMEFLLDYLEKNLVESATGNQFGHYLAKNFIKNFQFKIEANKDYEKDREEKGLPCVTEETYTNRRVSFLKAVVKNIFFLVPHKYGHFVIVDLIENWGSFYCKGLISLFVEKIENFCQIIYGYAIAKRIFIVYYEDKDFIENYSHGILKTLKNYDSLLDFNLSENTIKAAAACSSSEFLTEFLDNVKSVYCKIKFNPKDKKKRLVKLLETYSQSKSSLKEQLNEIFIDTQIKPFKNNY